MARSRAFDEHEVLDRAVELFWERGFEATSIADLEEELGIGRQSLYNTFGDKQQLFLRALERYMGRHGEMLNRTLLQPESGLDAIRVYFDELVRMLTGRGARKGCFVANSILETQDEDLEVSSRCRRNRHKVTEAFRHALRNAVATGELDPGFDPQKGANLLMTQVYGLTVLSKSGASARELRDSAVALVDRL